jgi:hypothetical protein
MVYLLHPRVSCFSPETLVQRFSINHLNFSLSHGSSLRPGLVRFNEETTISYAVDKNDNPLTTFDEL